MFIPGFIISILTFPGVIAHEFAHKLFCQLTGTNVIKVCYFRFGNPAGYVVHEQPASIWKHILIGFGPFFVNTLFGITIGLAAYIFKGEATANYLLAWLGVSIGMHSFPSSGDAKSIWSAVWQKGSPITARIVGTPLVGCILLGALGSFFWLDAIYGVAVSLVLPRIILGYYSGN